jgi:hypothetical protein
MAHILQPKAPNLTLPTIEYSEDQLYFNQLDNANKEEIKNLHTSNVMHWMGI